MSELRHKVQQKGPEVKVQEKVDLVEILKEKALPR